LHYADIFAPASGDAMEFCPRAARLVCQTGKLNARRPLLLLRVRWHIFTAIGAYIFIVLVEYLTTEISGTDPTGLYAWPTSNLLMLVAEGSKGANEKQE
jgi:hypothetical protein